MIFPVSYFLFSRREQINLVELLPLAQIHHIFFQIGEIIFCEMMFITGTGIAGTLHKVLTLHIMFT